MRITLRIMTAVTTLIAINLMFYTATVTYPEFYRWGMISLTLMGMAILFNSWSKEES